MTYEHHGERTTRGRQPAGCVIYVRMSKADIRRARQQAHGDPELLAKLIAEKIAIHLAECRAYARAEGWAILGEWTDNMISGDSRHRGASQVLAGREAMLTELRRRAGQRIIVLSTEVERLYRDLDESRELVRIAQFTPIVVISTDDEEYDLSTANGEDRFNGAVSKAQRENGKISERRRRKERARAAAGGYWGNDPFGYHKVYDTDPETGNRYYTSQLELCDENCPGRNGCMNTPGLGYPDAPGDDEFFEPGRLGEAALIRAAARRIIGSPDEPGRSLHSVVLDWDQLNIRTRNGKRWDQPSLRRMLLNKRLNGVCVHHGGGKWGRAPRGSRGTERPDSWDKILDDDLFLALRGVLTASESQVRTSNGKIITVSHVHKGGNARKYLLAGLAFCSECGGRMKGIPGKTLNDGTETRRYRCPPFPDGCAKTTRTTAIADAWVTEHVLRWTAPEGPYRLYVAEAKAAYEAAKAETAAELAQIDTAQQDQVTLLTGLSEAMAAGDILPGSVAWDTMMAAMERIETKQQELAARATTLSAAAPDAPPDAGQLGKILAPDADVVVRHEWIRKYVDRVIIHPPGRGTRFLFDPATIEVIPGAWAHGLDPAGLADAAPEPPQHNEAMRTSITRYLAEHPGGTSRDIADALERNISFTCTVLQAMREAGEVVGDQPGRGGPHPVRYTLPGVAMPAAPARPKRGAETRALILAYLAEHPGATARAITEATGKGQSMVSYCLGWMRDDGELTASHRHASRTNPVRYTLVS